MTAHRLLTATAAAVLLGGPAMAQVDPKIKIECMKAQDFAGCVKILSGGLNYLPETSQIAKLREALKLLPDRLQNTNLRDFTLNTQIFFDAVALINPSEAKNQDEKNLISEANSIKAMAQALQRYWSLRISDGTFYGKYGTRSYNCSVLSPLLDEFNLHAGSKYSVIFNGEAYSNWLLGKGMNCASTQEYEMIAAIRRRASEALVDPELRKAELTQIIKENIQWTENQKRIRELDCMGPWKRYLEENPKIKNMFKINPSSEAAAEKEYLSGIGMEATDRWAIGCP